MPLVRSLAFFGVLACAAIASAADVTVKGVHLCCGACENDAKAALADLKGVTGIAVDRNTKVIAFKGENAEAVTDAVESLADAGFHGTLTIDGKASEFPSSGAKKDEKLSVVTLTGVHLCCGACVTGAQKSLETVEGVAKIDIDRKERTIVLTGTDIETTAAVAALNKGGFHCTVKAKK